ncbi:MAG: hypothetical protein C0501_08055 [Isosphaera sp.]|nr:hypothetical protein [Isosphaera sp.]
MATTDPPYGPGPSQPREIPHVGGTEGIADGSKPDDHDGIGGPTAEALKAGYEPDGYDTRSVVSVPVIVVAVFVIAFGTTTALFAYFTSGPANPTANPQAAERNRAPLAERMQRIQHGSEVDRPRNDGLRVRDGDARAITRPEVPGTNPAYLHPEDIHADPARTPELYRTGDGRVPIDRVMAAADPKWFPAAAKDGQSPPPTWATTPLAANAGRGAHDAVVIVPQLPAGAAPKGPPPPKKDDPKKEEKKDGPVPPKKEEGKK